MSLYCHPDDYTHLREDWTNQPTEVQEWQPPRYLMNNHPDVCLCFSCAGDWDNDGTPDGESQTKEIPQPIITPGFAPINWDNDFDPFLDSDDPPIL